MFKQACMICKVVGVIAIVGALNWGIIALSGTDVVESVLGAGTIATRIVYGLVGLSGLALLASFFMVCPACKK